MAMTAWSAKVFSSSTWLSGNGPGSGRPTPITPIGSPALSMGAARKLRKPAVLASLLSP